LLREFAGIASDWCLSDLTAAGDGQWNNLRRMAFPV
jgi:hypothetical protein